MGMVKKTDQELIGECKGGDQEAITELFQRHYPASIRVARGVLRSLEEAQDAVQSAYLSAFRHLDSFRGDAAFKTWIARIVLNHCLMRLREPARRRTWVNLDELDENGIAPALVASGPTPEESTLSVEIGEAISRAASRLPRPLREAFTLHTGAGLSLQEVAGVLGLTVAGAKTRLFRAHARMRLHLRPVWSDLSVRGAAPRARPCASSAAN
jgi:RNA polymerase sigma-70 factor (ECF subfamily)